MTKREEAIEAMARAMFFAHFPLPGNLTADQIDNVWQRAIQLPWRKDATAAFDAAVKVLSEPDEGMIDAFSEVCVDCGAYDPPLAREAFQAMIKAAAR